MTPQNTYMRAPTRLACKTFIEAIVDHVAQLSSQPAEAVRARNLAKSPPVAEPPRLPPALAEAARLSTPVPSGVPEIPAKMFQAIMVSANFAQQQQAASTFNAQNLWKKRGVAAVPTEYSCGWGGVTHHGAKLDVYPDGTILVFVSGQELGQGLYTKCAQIAALLLGLPDTSLIEVSQTSTSMTPEGGGTYGSMASGANAWGMQLACQELKARLKPVEQALMAAQGREAGEPLTWQETITAAVSAGVDLSVKSWDHDLKVSGNGYGAAVASVELDVLTGEVQILRADLLYDCGKSLSPEIDIGQVEGAFVIGLGHFLTEALRYDDQTGELQTFDTWEYKPPQSLDIPIEWHTTLLKDITNPAGFMGSKAVGEPPLLLSAAVFHALKQAIYSSREDAGRTGYFALDVPATPAQVRQLLPSVGELV
jgi:xanthine dehydrogenase/oxidase